MPNNGDLSRRRFSTLQTEPLRNFKFHVVFTPRDGLNTGNLGRDIWDETSFGGFTNISGLSIATEPIPYREGGYNTSPHQIAGITTFAPIAMSRGVMYGQPQALRTMGQLFRANNGTDTSMGDVVKGRTNYRYDIEIFVLHHPREMGDLGATKNFDWAMKFTVYNAWLSTVSYGDLDAGSQGILVEQMAWVHEGWEASLKDDITVA